MFLSDMYIYNKNYLNPSSRKEKKKRKKKVLALYIINPLFI